MKRKATVLAFCAWITSTLCISYAQTGAYIDPDLSKAIERRAHAERTRDVETFGQLTADDFTLTNQYGEVITKAARMEQLKASPKHSQPSTTEDTIRMYGSATALRSRRVNRDGKATRMLTVWVKQAGEWKVATTQVTAEQSGGSAPSNAARPESAMEEEILALEARAWDSAMKGDYTMDILDETYVGISSTGRGFGNKATAIDNYRSGRIKILSQHFTDQRVRLFGDTAVVTGTWHAEFPGEGGKSVNRAILYTHVWARRSTGWKIVNWQGTSAALAEPQGGPSSK